MNNPNNLNINLCHSVKNKNNLNIQCTNKPKKDEILCGTHIKSKNVILFNLKKVDINNLLENKCENMDVIEKQIYSVEEIFKIISKNLVINVYNLRQSIKNSYLNKIINSRQSKQTIINDIKKIIVKERFYISYQSYIILIQSSFRRWLIYRKKKCNNDTDILTFTSKYDIPNNYFYTFNDILTKKKYAYDIRTLLQIINSDYSSCPYTFRPFTQDEINNIINHKNKLLKWGINIETEKNILSPEEETDMKIKDVFYQINMLDNYTNHLWFKNLNLNELFNLYIVMEDIWNYRSNMDIESKKKIIKNGQIFTISIPAIKQQKSIIKMQNIILDEFIRLITEGVDREEKKLGAILILTGLVEISIDASFGLPHLIQV